MRMRIDVIKSRIFALQIFGLVLLAVVGQTARAGQWVLDRYEYERYSEGVEFGEDNLSQPPTHYYGKRGVDWDTKPQIERGVMSADVNSHIDLSSTYSGLDVFLTRAAAHNISYKLSLTVTPVYVWQGDGVPSPEFWVREWGHLSVLRTHDGEGVTYTEQNPYNGEGFNIIKAYDGFDDIPVGIGTDYHHDMYWHFTVGWWNYCQSSFNSLDGPWHLKKILTVPGAVEVRGETRNLAAEVEFSGAAGDAPQMWSSYARAWYKAEVIKFELDVDGNLKQELGFPLDPTDPDSEIYKIPHNRGFAAYADKNWTNQWVADLTPPGPMAPPEEIAEYEANMAKPIKPFWDGAVEYAVNMSNNLSSMLRASPPVYQWNKGEEHLANSHVVTLPPVEDIDSPGFLERQRQMFPTDTRIKDIHHNVQNYPVGDGDTAPYSLADGEWPRITKTRVEVKFGSQADFATLEARARIEWYYRPSTYYKVEIETTYINLETGDEVSAPVNFEDPADAYAAEVQAAYGEFFQTFDEVVGDPLRLTELGYEIAFVMIVPDEWDIVAASIPVAGEAAVAAHKVFKVGKGVIRFAEFAAKLTTKLAGHADEIRAAGRTALQVADDVPIIARTRLKLVRMRRGGKLPSGAVREEAKLGEIERKTCWTGQFCFAASTLVVMADGTLKPVEQVKVGDLVLSKDENTGQVGAKRVSHTTQRQAPSTLVLSFGNGERIETTAEHPIYVEHKGFTPAGLLAIGNAIVTRAGPSLAVASIEKKSTPAPVYNFTVEDYHTYFVGNSALWVHNVKCVTEPRWRGGGTVAKVKPNEVKIDPETGLLKTTHGVSLFDNADQVRNFGGAYRVANIPDGLKIEQRGQNLSHYEIMPEHPMTMEEFVALLEQVVLVAE